MQVAKESRTKSVKVEQDINGIKLKTVIDSHGYLAIQKLLTGDILNRKALSIAGYEA